MPDILERSKINSIGSIIHRRTYSGRLMIFVRMPDSRIPKQVFYGGLFVSETARGNPRPRFKDCVKTFGLSF